MAHFSDFRFFFSTGGKIVCVVVVFLLAKKNRNRGPLYSDLDTVALELDEIWPGRQYVDSCRHWLNSLWHAPWVKRPSRVACIRSIDALVAYRTVYVSDRYFYFVRFFMRSVRGWVPWTQLDQNLRPSLVRGGAILFVTMLRFVQSMNLLLRVSW